MTYAEARSALKRHRLMLKEVDQADADGLPFSPAHRAWLWKQITDLRTFLGQARKQAAA
jgi:hypothetical protein